MQRGSLNTKALVAIFISLSVLSGSQASLEVPSHSTVDRLHARDHGLLAALKAGSASDDLERRSRVNWGGHGDHPQGGAAPNGSGGWNHSSSPSNSSQSGSNQTDPWSGPKGAQSQNSSSTPSQQIGSKPSSGGDSQGSYSSKSSSSSSASGYRKTSASATSAAMSSSNSSISANRGATSTKQGGSSQPTGTSSSGSSSSGGRTSGARTPSPSGDGSHTSSAFGAQPSNGSSSKGGSSTSSSPQQSPSGAASAPTKGTNGQSGGSTGSRNTPGSGTSGSDSSSGSNSPPTADGDGASGSNTGSDSSPSNTGGDGSTNASSSASGSSSNQASGSSDSTDSSTDSSSSTPTDGSSDTSTDDNSTDDETCEADDGTDQADSSDGSSPTGGSSNSTSTDRSNAGGNGNNSTSSGSPVPGSGPWSLVKSHAGSNFFDGFNFFHDADPTHGKVQYVDQGTAQSQGLISTSGGSVKIGTSTSDIGSGAMRQSVRLGSQDTYDEGLVVFDVAHLPVGCATWPALWLVGPGWPNAGEIDVVENVGFSDTNQYTLHTKPGCQIQGDSFTGSLVSRDCNAYASGNAGCAIRDKNANGPSFGPGFNSAGGGVWAAMFTQSEGVKIWFWGRSKVPSSLKSGTPQKLDPSSFGQPVATFPLSGGCAGTVSQQQIIVNIAIDGDWAGKVPMDGQCGSDRNAAYSKGSNYKEAFFRLNAINVYAKK